MQTSFVQSINALLQQFQPSQPPPTPPPQVPSLDVLQRQLLQSIQTIDHTSQQPGIIELLQSLHQRQTRQSPSTPIPSSQLLSDALKMIAPVGQSPNDEQLLVMALHSGLSQGLNHRRAIETLHGVNNHAANLWKDYYLEHRSHIDEMVNQLQPIKTAKKPVRFDLEPKSSSSSSEIKKKKERPENVRSLSVPLEPGSSRRNVIPRTHGSPLNPGARRHRGSPRRSNLPLPPPPQVEPIPPTKVVKHVRGNLYTIEDRKYFAKYISWVSQRDPFLTKNQIIAKLAENVPHHTAVSWGGYWARDPLADRILAAARERAIGTYQDQDSTGEAGEEEESVGDGQEQVEEGSSHNSDEDEAAMGEHGSLFGEAEIRVMAKYIARHTPDEWDMMTSKQRWFPFHEEHPHRTDKAYGEKYRQKEQELLNLAERYRRRAQRQLEKQCATPSWASVGRKRGPSAHGSPSKRVRD